MKLQLYLSCWANEIDLATAVSEARRWGYDGIEGPPPAARAERGEIAAQIADMGIPYIAELVTGGDYVPVAAMSVGQHLDDLERQLAGRLIEFEPLLVNVLGGSDRWGFAECVEFYSRGMELGRQYGREICWETHRSRPTFNPWATRDLLVELPGLRLNCDFSHWCVVCERLVMDEEPEILELCAERCRHLHARVGYPQGPQVPEPRDRLYRSHLDAHLRWWGVLLRAAERRGSEVFTATAEFGPDGYLQARPYTHEPVADLRELNSWMAQQLIGITESRVG